MTGPSAGDLNLPQELSNADSVYCSQQSSVLMQPEVLMNHEERGPALHEACRFCIQIDVDSQRCVPGWVLKKPLKKLCCRFPAAGIAQILHISHALQSRL